MFSVTKNKIMVKKKHEALSHKLSSSKYTGFFRITIIIYKQYMMSTT